MTSGGPAELPLHHRTLDFTAYDDGEHLRVVGRLRDSRPWAVDGTSEVHDMELRVRVRRRDLTITDCEAVMHAFPHAECPGIVAAFAGLAGLRTTRGFTRAVQSLVGGPNGCTHLDQLARALGPVVVQAATSWRARELREGRAADLLPESQEAPFARGTCHVWAEGGVGERKLAAGWRPGRGRYPAPPLEEIVAGGGGGEDRQPTTRSPAE